jgi:cell division transport system permease protein
MSHFIITVFRVLKAGLQNLIRNLTLTTILLLVIANATLSNTVDSINSKISISIYLNDSVTQQQTSALISQLRQTGEVQSVQYISKAQALAIYEKQNQGNHSIESAVAQTDNPLPATINVVPKNPSNLGDIRNILNSPTDLALQSDPSSYSGTLKEAINKIAKTTTLLREAGIVSIFVFAAISVLIIFNTIRMTIFNRRDELQIMRLLGASTWFIRGPYVVENILYGIISAGISLAFVNILFNTISNSLEASSLGLLNISYSETYLKKYFWYILVIQFAIGILIGAVSSVIATRRYLKFKTSK